MQKKTPPVTLDIEDTFSQIQETRDPGSVLEGGGLLPLGGSEISGLYKLIYYINYFLKLNQYT